MVMGNIAIRAKTKSVTWQMFRIYIADAGSSIARLNISIIKTYRRLSPSVGPLLNDKLKEEDKRSPRTSKRAQHDNNLGPP
jgi:hypothetical protein